MPDKMTIVDKNGKAKYVLTDTDTIVDMRLYEHCLCDRISIKDPIKPYQIKGGEKICPICNLAIPLEENNG
jgi:hypothetical protein